MSAKYMNRVKDDETVQKSERRFLSKKERLISFTAFVAGFIFDWVTLTRVDLIEACIVLGIYLAVIAACIVVFNSIEEHAKSGSFVRRSVAWLPYLIQFMFGTLFNASFIFYTQSAEFGVSWPFLFLLAAIIFGNELLRERQHVLTFQIVMFFIAEFLYLVTVVPIIVGTMSRYTFVSSGLISLAILAILAAFLSRLAHLRFLESRYWRIFIVIGLILLMNFLYFTNIIPPIPLSLRSIGIHHSVNRIDDFYVLQSEESPTFLNRLTGKGVIYHAAEGESAYVFSSVFAPTKITVPIFHRWSYFDEYSNEWIIADTVRFQIFGGRDGGYRGYSRKDNIFPGDWRVDILTQQGQRVGSLSFTVVRTNKRPLLFEQVI